MPLFVLGLNSGYSDDDSPGSLLELDWIRPIHFEIDQGPPTLLISCHSDGSLAHMVQFVTEDEKHHLVVLLGCCFGAGRVEYPTPFVLDGDAYVLITHASEGNHPTMTYRVYSFGRLKNGVISNVAPFELELENPLESLASLVTQGYWTDGNGYCYVQVHEDVLSFSYAIWKEGVPYCSVSTPPLEIHGTYRVFRKGDGAAARLVIDSWKVTKNDVEEEERMLLEGR